MLVAQSCLTLTLSWTVAHHFPLPWDSPGKNTRRSIHSLLQGIFPTQGLNLGLLHCRWILYCLSYQESSSMLSKINIITYFPWYKHILCIVLSAYISSLHVNIGQQLMLYRIQDKLDYYVSFFVDYLGLLRLLQQILQTG